MEILIQRTKPNDFLITENITRETFWNLFKSGCDEHLVLHNIRKSNCYVSSLDMVALSENRIIGHIISTKAKVVDKQNNEHHQNALLTVKGKFYEDKAFETNEEELNEFEKLFPKKEKGKPKIDINQ